MYSVVWYGNAEEDCEMQQEYNEKTKNFLAR